MNRDRQPNQKRDYSKFVARFGCGAIFGITLAIAGGAIAYPTTATGLLAVIIMFALASGLLSVIFGDKFWTNLWKWLP
ncbi:MAG: hypothetical protein QNJ49_09800 [Mastigocoleus sp. MO_167.B18]|nr:hypothetical protein [Mastigocoleus sp. MO_167.B18]